MSGAEIKQWMEMSETSVLDIFRTTGIHPQTIYKFLNGKTVSHGTRSAIQLFVELKSRTLDSDKKRKVAV